jgi:hypothetical protein
MNRETKESRANVNPTYERRRVGSRLAARPPAGAGPRARLIKFIDKSRV